MNSRFDTAKNLFLEGTSALEKGDLDSAELNLIECLRLIPDQESTKHNLAILFTLRADALSELEKHDEALISYSKALEFDENYAIAWSNKGVILNDHFDVIDEAISCFERALQLIPSYADAHLNLGVAHAKNKNYSKAFEHYESALKYDPHCVEAWINRGNAFNDLKRHEEALASFGCAIKLQPNLPEAWGFQSKAFNDLKRHEEALASADNAIRLRPHFVEAWNNRGVALGDLKRHEEALASYERSIELKPDHAEAWSNRGNALNDLRRHEEALASYERSIELKPDYAEAWSNRGVALNDLRRHGEALASYERSIELKPDHAEAWSNRGNALNDLRRHEEALASYERSIELKPDYAEAWSNRGVALNDLRRHGEALASYERSIELKPDYAEAFNNKGLLQLSQKEFLSGFENILWRWKTKDFLSQPLKTVLPHCNPSIRGKNLLLWAEQGIGDEIFYAGLLPVAQGRFSSISLVANTRLHPILARSFPKIALLDRNQTTMTESIVGMDFQAPIGDLGHLLRLSSEEIKETRRPFLKADQTKLAAFESKALFSSGKIVCGLAWRSHNKRFGEEKSIGLKQLEPILRNPQLEFINLQYGGVDSEIREAESRFGATIHQIRGLDVYYDIDGLLAVINACDMVITTSNVTAHLAGSIGKKGCLLVPYSKGKIWYWHLNDTYCFWYPSLRVLYQGDRYDWTDTIRQARKWMEQNL